jgi:hypothetical protein
MRQFISETEDLVYKDFFVSQKKYQNMVDRFGSEREALDALEFQIQIHMRNYKQAQTDVNRLMITVAVHPVIDRLLNAYAEEHHLEINKVLERIMSCTKKR